MAQNGSVKIIRPKDIFFRTTDEFYAWKKTPQFKQWRAKQFYRQNKRCYYCLRDISQIINCIEHINPRNRGGSNRPGNLVLSCLPCNEDKGSRKLTVREKKFYRDRYKKGLASG